MSDKRTFENIAAHELRGWAERLIAEDYVGEDTLRDLLVDHAPNYYLEELNASDS